MSTSDDHCVLEVGGWSAVCGLSGPALRAFHGLAWAGRTRRLYRYDEPFFERLIVPRHVVIVHERVFVNGSADAMPANSRHHA